MGRAGRVTGRGERRLLLALAASALLHGALLQALEGAAQRRVRLAAAPPLSATLTLPYAHEAPRVAEPPAIDALYARREPGQITLSPPPPAAEKPSVAVPLHKPAPHAAAASMPGEATVTHMSDPTYYGARSLDVFPKSLTALALRSITASGKVRATVFIDEAGAVNDVRAIEAANAEAEQAARELLLQTRFTPAYKDGRVVKAQVVVSLE